MHFAEIGGKTSAIDTPRIAMRSRMVWIVGVVRSGRIVDRPATDRRRALCPDEPGNRRVSSYARLSAANARSLSRNPVCIAAE